MTTWLLLGLLLGYSSATMATPWLATPATYTWGSSRHSWLLPPSPVLGSSIARYDTTGLIWLLQGRPVIALTETEAAIQSAGAVVMYRKHNKPTLGPLGDSLDDVELRP
jgi:hypothetical protein